MVSNRSIYSAAKSAVNVLTANLRMDLRAKYPRIKVSLVLPGIVDTHFHRVAGTPIAMKAGNSLCEKFVSALKSYVGGDDWVKDLTTNLKLTLTPAQIKTRFSTLGQIDDHHCR